MMSQKCRVGIVGYGKLGQYLAHAIIDDPMVGAKLELAFVWNRTPAAVRADDKIPSEAVLDDLTEFASRNADLIVEVAHPDITRDFGRKFLHHAAYLCGSPTAFANDTCEAIVNDLMTQQRAGKDTSGDSKDGEATMIQHAMYIPSGALWGAKDIQKMANRGTLKGLCITMKKAPGPFRSVQIQ